MSRPCYHTRMKTGIRTEIDLHGYLLADAERVFYEFLNEARLNKKAKEVTFITGTGKIQERLMRLGRENDVHSYIPLANRGCLIMEFE